MAEVRGQEDVADLEEAVEAGADLVAGHEEADAVVGVVEAVAQFAAGRGDEERSVAVFDVLGDDVAVVGEEDPERGRALRVRLFRQAEERSERSLAGLCHRQGLFL